MAVSSKPLLISIVGPTAVGKTSLAIELASWLETEIVSSDSRQFYREMEIGTAKPSNDELATVTHHFINSHSIDQNYSAGSFGRDAVGRIEKIQGQRMIAIAVGGSGLYLKAIWDGFDDMPEVDEKIRLKLNAILMKEGLAPLLDELQQEDPAYFSKVDKQNGQRVIRALEVIRSSGQPFSSFRKEHKKEMPYRHLKIGLNTAREKLFERINLRMDQMIEAGLFDEAEYLYPFKEHNALQTVGYSEIFKFMDGEYNKEEAIRLLKRNSRRYAKRQLTWFGKYDDIHWFEPDQIKEIKTLIQQEIP